MQARALAERVEQNQRDVELLHRIRGKDQGALSLLYDRYAFLLYSIAFRVVPSAEEAEDIVQEVFTILWTKAETYSVGRGTVYCWIVATCRNRAIDRLRSKGFKSRPKEIGLETIAGISGHERQRHPAISLLFNENRHLIGRALSTLTKAEARILELSYYQGHSRSEISKMLKTPLGTVKTRMRQAVIKLRTVLHKQRG